MQHQNLKKWPIFFKVSIHFHACHPQCQATGNSFSTFKQSLITKPDHHGSFGIQLMQRHLLAFNKVAKQCDNAPLRYIYCALYSQGIFVHPTPNHTWLRYEKDANPSASADGCTNFGTSTLQRHKDCKEHEDAVNEEDTFSKTQCRVLREQSQAILTAMRAVYWLDKVDIHVATVKHDS